MRQAQNRSQSITAWADPPPEPESLQVANSFLNGAEPTDSPEVADHQLCNRVANAFLSSPDLNNIANDDRERFECLYERGQPTSETETRGGKVISEYHNYDIGSVNVMTITADYLMKVRRGEYRIFMCASPTCQRFVIAPKSYRGKFCWLGWPPKSNPTCRNQKSKPPKRARSRKDALTEAARAGEGHFMKS